MMPNGMPMMPMNPMMGINGMNGFSGFPNMYNPGAGGFGGMNNIGMMNGNMGAGNGILNGGGAQNGGNANGATGAFPNQQKTVFAEPLPNEEDNAYFRKPVNPHRHQGRQKRVRPSDYREL